MFSPLKESAVGRIRGLSHHFPVAKWLLRKKHKFFYFPLIFRAHVLQIATMCSSSDAHRPHQGGHVDSAHRVLGVVCA